MAEDPSVPLDLQPGSIVMIKGRSWVVDALRAGRDGDMEIQTTRRTERRSETVLWPADVVQGLVLRRRAQGAPPPQASGWAPCCRNMNEAVRSGRLGRRALPRRASRRAQVGAGDDTRPRQGTWPGPRTTRSSGAVDVGASPGGNAHQAHSLGELRIQNAVLRA